MKESESIEKKENIKSTIEHMQYLYETLVEMEDNPALFLTREQRKVFEKIEQEQEVSEEEQKLIEGYNLQDFKAYMKNIYRKNNFTRATLAIDLISMLEGFSENNKATFQATKKSILSDINNRERSGEHDILLSDVVKIKELSGMALREAYSNLPESAKLVFVKEVSSRQYKDANKEEKRKSLLNSLQAQS